jgi:hypothetical protein
MAQVMTSDRGKARGGVGLRSALGAGLAGGGIAALANIVVLLVAQNLLGVRMEVPMGPGGPPAPLGPVQVALISLMPGLVAGAVLWLMAKMFARPARAFLALSVVVLLLSFVPTFTVPGIAADVRLVLALMHPVAAAAIVGALYRAAKTAG